MATPSGFKAPAMGMAFSMKSMPSNLRPRASNTIYAQCGAGNMADDASVVAPGRATRVTGYRM